MANYLLAYHGGKMPANPKELQSVMTAWDDWYSKLGGALVDGGNPVGSARTISGAGSVSDGGGANPVSGYTVISAENLDAAVKLAQSCPVLMAGASVEVCETVDVM